MQTLSQLKELYGDGWNTIMTNCDLVSYFAGTSDLFSAEIISKLLGLSTQTERSVSEPGTPGQWPSDSYRTYGRPLRTPDEVMRIPEGVQYILRAGKNPVIGALFEKDLRSFPEYTAFQAGIERGMLPKDAAKFAKRCDDIARQAANENSQQQKGWFSRKSG